MTQIVLEFEPGTFSTLCLGPKEFAGELKIAAVVQWYTEGRVSQSKASEMLVISRAAFLDELCRRKVPACQVSIDELREGISGF